MNGFFVNSQSGDDLKEDAAKFDYKLNMIY